MFNSASRIQVGEHMTQVMKGVRVLEVAQFTFVPAAGAILADWGADVIKIEHPKRGDTQRGFINMGGIAVEKDRNPLVEHPNRGKRSVGIDLSTAEGQAVLYEIAKTADVRSEEHTSELQSLMRISSAAFCLKKKNDT